LKIIKTNSITGITASSSDASYPASYLLNTVPRKPWKAASSAVTSCTLSVSVTGGTNAIGLVGIVADSVRVQISSPVSKDVTTAISSKFQGRSNLWIDIPTFSGAGTITVTLTKAASSRVMSVGVVAAGAAETFNPPNYGITESPDSYSVIKTTSNGEPYCKKRDAGRVFTWTVKLLRDTLFYDFFYDIAYLSETEPKMWLLVENSTQWWAVYGRLQTVPRGNHQNLNHSLVDCELTQPPLTRVA